MCNFYVTFLFSGLVHFISVNAAMSFSLKNQRLRRQDAGLSFILFYLWREEVM